ncbi:MAG: glycosyltransferase [Proteobacteria bacterium]|nr:glycosyltransferase [Pseudomonadota bacterium]
MRFLPVNGDAFMSRGGRILKILHVITGLSTGGAEMMLFKLLSRLVREDVGNEVISLTGIGPVGERIADLGIEVHALGIGRALPSPPRIFSLARMMRESQPDIVHAWMYHANLLAGLAAKIARSPPVIWGIRQSNLDPRLSKRSTLLTASLCARLSARLPARILCCSTVARDVHVAQGYAPEKMAVIPNGFDLERFRPDGEARIAVRRELGIGLEAPLIGLVARFDPQKDHRSFIRAAARLLESGAGAHFLLCGEGIDADNRELGGWIEAAGIGANCHLLGLRDDMAAITAALDIAVSSSAFGEGFSNAVAEAMACGVPCVVTDVGDSGLMVEDTGRVVAPKDAEALGDAMAGLLAIGAERRAELGRAARRRVEENYSLADIAARHLAFYRETLSP